MKGRPAPPSALRWRRYGACRHILLRASIAMALAGRVLPAAAMPVDGVASAPPDAAADANSNDASFDRNLLSGSSKNTTDLSRFEHGNPVLPGRYNADVYLNTVLSGRSNVRFATVAGQESASACVDRHLLDQLGLHPPKLSADLVAKLQDPAACVDIASLIPDATVTFDMAELRIDVSVPQTYLGQTPRGYVSPESWDAGVPAGLLNYSFNSYRTTNEGQDQTSAYLGLNAGFNYGPWHFRQDSTLNWQSASGSAPARRHWQNIDTYVQRDLPAWRAQLTLGDSYTDGQVFDSFGLRGVQIASDDRMLPDSLRGYAPVVRGVADTNAKVTVRQNGVLIYQTTVAPGPFAISDLYPTGYGGSLDVTVTEADGRARSFSVPYASVVQLLRPGITRFDIAVGQLRDQFIEHQPAVAQAALQHGFTNLLTGYAGLVGSQGYASALIGSALNTRYGAVALDLSHSRTDVPGYSTQAGQSVRLSYSKIFTDTNTSLSVAAYRYSTSGYLNLTDAALTRDDARRGIDPFDYVAPTALPTTDDGVLTPAQQASLFGTDALGNSLLSSTGLQRQRGTFSISVSQQLGAHGGSFYANASTTNYWNSPGTNTQFQAGYNNTFHRVSYSLSATRSRDQLGRNDNQYLVSFSVPLGDGAHAPTLSFNASHDQTGSQDQAMVSGSLGADNQVTYGATATHGSGETGNSGSVNGGYRSPYAIFNGSYGSGSGYSQTSLSVTGAVVAHPGGITFGQPTGDTVAVVFAPDANGARLTNASGVRIDSAGYALVPYLTPYNLNTIGIDPKGLPLDVQLDATSAQVAPHAGAVVMLKFRTESGRTIIVRARLPDGQALPFGAEVFNAQNQSLGVVGQAGQVLLRGVDQSGLLSARWQDDDGNKLSCSFHYRLPATTSKHVQRYEEIQATCLSNTPVAMAGGSQ
jgi:outer membrane usher protein